MLCQPHEGAQQLSQSLNQEGLNRQMETGVEGSAGLGGEGRTSYLPGLCWGRLRLGGEAQGLEFAVKRSREPPGSSPRIVRPKAGAH